jgi:hypothetical protein
MSTLRVVVSDLVMAALTFGSSVWLFCFGTDGFLATFYGFFPLHVRENLYDLLPPERAQSSQDVSDVGALILIIVFLWFASDIWLSFPKWRITLTAVILIEFIVIYQFLSKVYTILPF